MNPNTMTALAKTKPEEGLWQIQAPIPEIGPEDVLIRIQTTGISSYLLFFLLLFKSF